MRLSSVHRCFIVCFVFSFDNKAMGLLPIRFNACSGGNYLLSLPGGKNVIRNFDSTKNTQSKVLFLRTLDWNGVS